MRILSYLFFPALLFLATVAVAQDAPTSIELNGDYVEYIQEENKAIAEGNVSVSRGDMTLYSDRLEFFREDKVGIAEGNVILQTPQGRMTGDKLVYDFEAMTGEFTNARIFSKPYYGAGEEISKVGENKIVVRNGYITTSDFDDPEYRLTSEEITLYPGDKAVARDLRMKLGDTTVAYLPRFTQDLKDKKAQYSITPGFDGDFGAFLLTQWRYRLSDNLKGTVHLDYRERRGFAFGLDTDYTTPNMGKGLLRTYYLNERDRGLFRDSDPDADLAERYKIEWRHKWHVDAKTTMIGQYYKLSDVEILREYFEREFEEDPTPETFFQLTRAMPKGTLSLRSDVRVNDFVDTIERLPELQYDITNQRIFGSNFYGKNTTTFTNLTKKVANVADPTAETVRLDTVSEVSYPMKVSFLEFRPFAGGRQTYYSDTLTDEDEIRGIFTTGADLSTKFYRIYEPNMTFFGEPLERLRHVLTPSIAYQFSTEPTVPPSELVNYDDIDTLDREHSILFSLENKLQTKQEDKSVDLLRAILELDYRLDEDALPAGFRSITSEIDFLPVWWLRFFVDSDYSLVKDKLDSINFDVHLKDPRDEEDSRWDLYVSKRLNTDVDDILTTHFRYDINPKWDFRAYSRFDISSGLLEEQEYAFVRDLHSWEMELIINDKSTGGTEVLIAFRLKAFPDIGFDFGATLSRRRTGSE